MREIKFRAWDGERIIPYEDMLLWDGGVLSSSVMSLRKEPYNYTYMQFTGLTDKNGIEIWEGDIVEQKNNIGMILGTYEIRWGHFGFQMFDYSEPEKTNNYVATAMLEVIGNVHENPELVK